MRAFPPQDLEKEKSKPSGPSTLTVRDAKPCACPAVFLSPRLVPEHYPFERTLFSTLDST